MLNLINRIIEITVSRITALIDTDEVREEAVQSLTEEGIDYNSLAGEIDMSELAGEFAVDEIADNIDKSDVARFLSEDSCFIDNLCDELRYNDRFMDRLVERTGVDELVVRVTALENAASTVAPTPEPTPEPEPTTVEVPAALTDRLLNLAVTRLLEMADEAVRDGKV